MEDAKLTSHLGLGQAQTHLGLDQHQMSLGSHKLSTNQRCLCVQMQMQIDNRTIGAAIGPTTVSATRGPDESGPGPGPGGPWAWPRPPVFTGGLAQGPFWPRANFGPGPNMALGQLPYCCGNVALLLPHLRNWQPAR